jgi:hypothetical protein
MLDVHQAEEGAFLPQLLVDRAVGVEDELAGEVCHVGGELAVLVNGGVIVQPVFHPDFIIFLAVPRGDVNTAGPRFQGNEGSEDEKALAVDEGMPALEPFHFPSGKLIQDLVGLPLPAERVQAVVQKVFCQDQDFSLHLDGDVIIPHERRWPGWR